MEIWMSNLFYGNSETQRAVMFTNRSFTRRENSLKMKAECLRDATRCLWGDLTNSSSKQYREILIWKNRFFRKTQWSTGVVSVYSCLQTLDIEQTDRLKPFSKLLMFTNIKKLLFSYC